MYTAQHKGPVLAVNVRGYKEDFVPSVTNGVVLELNYQWPDPGRPPPPPAPPQCKGLPGISCPDCPPAGLPLKCPQGQRVDYIPANGDDGSCTCDEFCASDWGGSVKALRPQWTGATSAFPPGVASTCCVCVQATHFCPKPSPGSGEPCQASCHGFGIPNATAYCVPDDPYMGRSAG